MKEEHTLNHVQQYAITDGTDLAGALLRWAAAGVDFVQVRAKCLETNAILDRTGKVQKELVNITALNGRAPKLLVNGRVDVAVAAGADGVHLTAHPDELSPNQVRRVFELAGRSGPLISVSAHNLAEVQRARANGADMVLFGPVFEKYVEGLLVAAGLGLEALHQACMAAANVPVLALGGVTLENAEACMAAGATGIAGIRLFR